MANERLHARAGERLPGGVNARVIASRPDRVGAVPGHEPPQALLGCADLATRLQVVANLQQTHGNAAVQRLLAPSAGPVVQRWKVDLSPGETDCVKAADYVSAHSPYKPQGWAKTKTDFAWTGAAQFATSGGKTTATITAPTVSKTATVDMPTWSPTDATMKKAWSTAMTELRAHEARHEAIGDTWKSNLTNKLTGLKVAVAKETDAEVHAAVQPKWNGWISDHQKDQNAIDPFSVTVDCAAASGEEDEQASAGDATGESLAASEGSETSSGESTAVASAEDTGPSDVGEEEAA